MEIELNFGKMNFILPSATREDCSRLIGKQVNRYTAVIIFGPNERIRRSSGKTVTLNRNCNNKKLYNT